MTRRFATLAVALLVVFTVAMPASATACCRTQSMMAAMHGTMPCCNHCKVTSAENQTQHDFDVTAPGPTLPTLAVAAIASAAPQPAAPPAGFQTTVAGGAASPPSPFLLNEQFRI